MLNQYFNENCLDTMNRMQDEYVDLVVTSPPYDVLRTYDGHVDAFDFETISQELYRVVKPGGVIVWVVADQVENDNESGTSFKQALHFQKIGFNLFDTMIYLKNVRGGLGSVYAYWNEFEYMFIFSKGRPKSINLIKDRKNEYRRTSGKGNRKVDGSFGKYKDVSIDEFGRRGNVWHYSQGLYLSTKEKVAFQHPAIFPDKLAKDHILSWSNEGDIVYDPFAGSGTTLKQAMIHKRRFIGSEISAKYCGVIKARLNTMDQFF